MISSYQLRELTIEITRKCPMRCTICSSEGGEQDPNEFSLIELQKIVDDAIPLGIKIILLSGGEPLESPYSLDLIQYAKEKGIQVFLYTCGNIKTKDGIAPINEKILGILKELAVDKVIFSIHGPNEEIHEKITTKSGSFSNLISSIEKSLKFGLDIELHFVPVLSNYLYLPQVIDLAENFGITKVSILRFVPQGRGAINRGELEIRGEKIRELKEILNEIQLNSALNVRLGAPFNCFNIDNNAKCSAGIDKAIIRPDGFVFPCVSMKKIFDNYSDNNSFRDSLSDIWSNSQLFNEIRDCLGEKNDCKYCEDFSTCHGGCLTQAYIRKKFDKKNPRDPYCDKILNKSKINGRIGTVEPIRGIINDST